MQTDRTLSLLSSITWNIGEETVIYIQHQTGLNAIQIGSQIAQFYNEVSRNICIVQVL